MINPYNNKNWCHHLNSLRWVKDLEDLELQKKILTSFYSFHCKRKIQNPYYFSIRGDHTAAIRMNVLIDIKKKFQKNGIIGGVGICKRLINEELCNLLRKDMYRAGHNHGLMVDLSILNLIVQDREFEKKIDIDFLLNRSANTLNNMWHISGFTKEHSISYQEFNLSLVISYYEKLKSLRLVSRSKIDQELIKDESKKILGFALRKSGGYFPIGDSFRKPNTKILGEIYGEGSLPPENTFYPYSCQEGEVVKEGLFIKKWRDRNNNEFHIIATCGWNSFNHKQNDEFSFCLDINGCAFFDDPGYSTACNQTIAQFLKSEKSHSNFSLEKCAWSDKRFSDGNSNIFHVSNLFENFSDTGLVMTHGRIEGFFAKRILQIKDGIINIIDMLNINKKNIYTIQTLGDVVKITHRFVLAPEVSVNIECGCIQLSVGVERCFLYYDSGDVSFKRIPYIGYDKTVVVSTIVLIIDSKINLNEYNGFNVVNKFKILMCDSF